MANQYQLCEVGFQAAWEPAAFMPRNKSSSIPITVNFVVELRF